MRNVDLAAVDELDDELEVVEADVLRHNDRRVFAGVRQQESLEVGAAGRQYHLDTQKRRKTVLNMKTLPTLPIKSRLLIKSRHANLPGNAKEAFVRSDCFHFASGKRAETTVVCSIARVYAAFEVKCRCFN